MIEPDNGGIRYSAGNPRFDLIPFDVLTELAQVYTMGAKKYGDEPGGARNWERGTDWGECIRGTMSHLSSFCRGEDWNTEDEGGRHHLDHAIWNLFALRAYTLRGIGTDDRNILKPGTCVPPEDIGGGSRVEVAQ